MVSVWVSRCKPNKEKRKSKLSKKKAQLGSTWALLVDWTTKFGAVLSGTPSRIMLQSGFLDFHGHHSFPSLDAIATGTAAAREATAHMGRASPGTLPLSIINFQTECGDGSIGLAKPR